MAWVRVWDLPTRLFHAALVLCTVGLVISGNVGGDAMVWHMRLGYGVLTLLGFRLLWGFLGGHWSRFVNLPLRPTQTLAYLRGERSPPLVTGHSPLGSLSVLALLLALLAQVGTGLFADDEIAYVGPLSALAPGDWVQLATTYHKQVGKWAVLGLVLLHLGAVIYHSLVKREGLVAAMWRHGHKSVPSPATESRDSGRSRLLAMALVGLCAWGVWLLVRLGQSVVAGPY